MYPFQGGRPRSGRGSLTHAVREFRFAHRSLSTGVRKYGDMMRNHKDTKTQRKAARNNSLMRPFFVSLWFLPYVTVIPKCSTKLTLTGQSPSSRAIIRTAKMADKDPPIELSPVS